MALALNRARSVQFLTMACKGCKIKVIIDLFVFDWLQFSLRISLAIQLLCCYPIPSLHSALGLGLAPCLEYFGIRVGIVEYSSIGNLLSRWALETDIT